MKDNKTVLVTGANGGIGKELCKLFLLKDYYVIATDVTKTSDCESSKYFQIDLSDHGQVDQLIELVASLGRKLDVLVNNAAFQMCSSLLDTDVLEWDKVFAVNVRAPFLLSRGFHSSLKQTKGSIVNITSVHAYASSGDMAAYASSKTALKGLTRNSALEFAEDGIRVNAVAPAAIDTEMLRDGLSRSHARGNDMEAKVSMLGKKHPLGRVGEASEIAKVVFFLADSEQSSFITGQTLVCDGGALVKLSTE